MKQQKINKFIKLVLIISLNLIGFAGGVKFADGKKYIKLGGRVQLQYHHTDSDSRDSEDELIFRRLRPYIEGSTMESWKAKFQWDMGKSKTEIKDMYFQYKISDNTKLTVGNANFPFSRELLTSSKKQQLVERTFVGAHNYGTPDRQVGLHLSGNSYSKAFNWSVSIAKGAVDPDNKKLDFDTVASLNSENDWSEGNMFGARISLQPLGQVKMSQTNFKDDFFKIAIGLGLFSWSNDDDNLTPYDSIENYKKNDVESVKGMEAAIAIRASILSLDLQYNIFKSELVDAGITSGLYKNSDTELKNYAAEGGIMLVPEKFEIVAGYQVQDADNYAEKWTRSSLGLNYYILKNNAKVQITYRNGDNKDGNHGNDVDEMFVQTQFVF